MAIDLKKLFSSNATTDDKFSVALLKAMKSGATPEFDYLKFKQSVKSLSDMNMDLETAFKSAFATASTMGLTKNKLMTSVKYYKRILDKEKSKFAEALQNQMDVRVSKKKEEASKVNDRVRDYELKIEKLKQEMEAYKQKISNVDAEIAEAKEKINRTKDEFLTAYDGLASVLEDDLDHMTSHL